MARKHRKADDAEITAVAGQLDSLLDDLERSVDALSAMLRRPADPPQGRDDERLAPL